MSSSQVRQLDRYCGASKSAARMGSKLKARIGEAAGRIIQREAKYLMIASSAGHGVFCVSTALPVPLSTSVC